MRLEFQACCGSQENIGICFHSNNGPKSDNNDVYDIEADCDCVDNDVINDKSLQDQETAMKK